MRKILSATILTSLLLIPTGQAHAKGVKLQEIWGEGTGKTYSAPKPKKKSEQLQQHIDFITKFWEDKPDKTQALRYVKQHRLLEGTLFIKLLPRDLYSDARFQKKAFKQLQKKQRRRLHEERMAQLRAQLQPKLGERSQPTGDYRSTQRRIKDLKVDLGRRIQQVEEDLRRASHT